MREIKFKFWNKQQERFSIENRFDFLEYPDKYIPLQYTGLKDKNGVKIYEGDILECEDNSKHKIEWSEDYACFCLSNRAYIGLNRQDMENYEVIGNIYQNKDLLN